jgi:elongation factor P
LLLVEGISVAAIKYIDVRKGMVLIGDQGELLQCLDRDLNTPGNWRAILYLKLRNLKTGSITDVRFKPDDKAELAFLDTREMTYSYREGDAYVFVDTETYEAYPLPAAFVGNQILYLRENDMVKVTLYEGKALDFEAPATVELTVTETEPGIKGATAAAQYKPATCETGLIVNVPSFINAGDKIKIDTKTGEYGGRV